MNATDNTDAPKRRIEDHTPDAKLDWTKPDAPAVPAAPVAPRPVPLRAVASMSVSDEGFSFFATPAAKMLEPGHYMLSAAGAVLPQVGAGAAQLQAPAPAAPAVPVIDAPRVEDWPSPADLIAENLDNIADQWEECMYDAPGETIDIGASLRIDFAKLDLTGAAPIARQAQPTDRDAADAARYRWLLERFTGYDFHWMGDPMAERDADKGKCVIVFECGQEFNAGRDVQAGIDAALKSGSTTEGAASKLAASL